jgi:hypothetical protein
MHLLRIALVITVCALAISASTGYSQQNLPPPGGYMPIPNFVGPDAGGDFRSAINDRFSGVQPMAPRVGSVPFASLGAEQDGAQLYCSDCQSTLPCVGGGTGAWALGTKGQWQCNAPPVALRLDGSDVLGPINGTRTNEKNILDFGAIASTARINCTTTSGQSNVICSGIGSSDFALHQYVALYGAGPAPTVAQPAGFTLQPTTTTNNPGAATQFTRFAQGCTVQNAVAWCAAGSSSCGVSNVSLYEQGQTVTIAGAGVGGAALTTTISSVDDGGNNLNLAAAASTTVSGAAMTGGNCTTSRRYQAFPIDSRGGWGPPTAVTTVNNTASALNWGDWVDVQVNVPQPPNAPNPGYPLPSNVPIAWAFYCGEGTAALRMCGVEVPTYSFVYNSSNPPPWNDQLLGGFVKGFPTVVTFHDVGKPYGNDVIQGATPPAGPVNQILFAKILSINGNTVQLSVAPAQSGTFTMGHDNGPNINNAIAASCDPNYRCGTVYTPYAPTLFPVATPIVALRGSGLHLMGGAGPIGAEPGPVAPSGWLWVGALGATMVELNQEAKPQVDNISLQSSIPGVAGSTMGVTIDMDGFDPGDGLGLTNTSGRQTFRDIYTGQASIGIRLGNINVSNCEFGVMESSIINWVYGTTFLSASNIGMLINSVNALAMRMDGSTLTGNIGLWSNQSGFYAVQTSMGQADGIAVFLGAGLGLPVTIETSRNEHMDRAIYSPVIGGAVGTQLAMRGDTWTDIRLPTDGDFIALSGGDASVLDGNEFQTSKLAVNNDFTTDLFPGGIIRAGAQGSVEARGNYWSTMCGDPYSFIAAVNASGDVCSAPDGSSHHLAPYSRGFGGFSFGTPTGGAMGEGSLNLSGLLFRNGQPLVNWGEASIASIAASGTSFATVNWNTPFSDANYDFSYALVDGAGFLGMWGANSKSATAVSFQVKNNDSSAAPSGTANCIAVHH